MRIQLTGYIAQVARRLRGAVVDEVEIEDATQPAFGVRVRAEAGKLGPQLALGEQVRVTVELHPASGEVRFERHLTDGVQVSSLTPAPAPAADVEELERTNQGLVRALGIAQQRLARVEVAAGPYSVGTSEGKVDRVREALAWRPASTEAQDAVWPAAGAAGVLPRRVWLDAGTDGILSVDMPRVRALAAVARYCQAYAWGPGVPENAQAIHRTVLSILETHGVLEALEADSVAAIEEPVRVSHVGVDVAATMAELVDRITKARDLAGHYSRVGAECCRVVGTSILERLAGQLPKVGTPAPAERTIVLTPDLAESRPVNPPTTG